MPAFTKAFRSPLNHECRWKHPKKHPNEQHILDLGCGSVLLQSESKPTEHEQVGVHCIDAYVLIMTSPQQAPSTETVLMPGSVL